MSSHRHNEAAEAVRTGDDGVLDAAHASILAVGWKRTTLTDVARRAGVSRMTIYRRWPDMQSLLGDLMTREWTGLGATPGLADQLQGAGPARNRIASGVAATVTAMRDNELFRTIVRVDPELLLPYLLERRGRSQEGLLAVLQAAIAEGQADGAVRAGDPALLARSVLLTATGFVFSAPTMVDGSIGLDDLDEQLRDLVERYLAP